MTVNYAVHNKYLHMQLIAYQATTSIATWILTFIIPLFILDITGSAFYTSLSYGIVMSPFIFMSPLAGVLGDIGNRKKKLASIEILFITFTFILLLFISLNKLPPSFLIWVIYFFYFFLASLGAAQHPIFQSVIPSLVHKDKLGQMNSSLASIDRCIFLLGPAAIGITLLFLSKQNIIFTAALFSLASLALILSIKFPSFTQDKSYSLKDLKASFSEASLFLKKHTSMQAIVYLFFLVNVGLHLFASGFVFYLKENHYFTEKMIGYTYSFIGLGSIVGAYFARYTIKESFSKEKVIYIASLAQGLVFCLMYFLLPFVYTTIFLWFVINALSMITVVNFFTYRQTETPNHLLGRIVGITRSISYIAIPFAALATGILQQNTQSLSCPVAIAAFLLTGSSVYLLYNFSRRNRLQ